jgi:hypothetical protein
MHDDGYDDDGEHLFDAYQTRDWFMDGSKWTDDVDGSVSRYERLRQAEAFIARFIGSHGPRGDVLLRVNYLLHVVKPQLREEDSDASWDYHNVLTDRIRVTMNAACMEKFEYEDDSPTTLAGHLKDRIDYMMTDEFGYGQLSDQVY